MRAEDMLLMFVGFLSTRLAPRLEGIGPDEVVPIIKDFLTFFQTTMVVTPGETLQ